MHRGERLRPIEPDRWANPEQFLGALIDASPLPIVAFSRDGCVTLWNSAAERVFGWTQAEVLGGPLPFIPQEKLDEHRQMRASDLDGHNFTEVEIRRVRKDGSPVDLRVSTSAIRDESGAVAAIISIYVDITERKNAEDALARQAEQLARSNADLQQFAYVTSHDLKEPLRTIASYTQLLEKRYRDILDEDGRKFMNYIVAGVDRMCSLVDDLLVYSRLANTETGRVRTVDLNGVVNWALLNLQSAILESGAKIDASNLPHVPGDQVQLLQLFQNLLSNAIKYRGTDRPDIVITAAQSGACWTIAVQDNGIGIDPMFHDRIFGVFKRLHGRDVPGTGIGLAICKKIVEKHGGKIWVESKPGEGCVFRFTLPVTDQSK